MSWQEERAHTGPRRIDTVCPDAHSALIVDDEPQICELIRMALSSEGWQCKTATNPSDAMQLVVGEAFAVIITDISMPNTNGLDLLAYIREKSPRAKVILITGHSKTEYLAQALELGAFEFLPKPLDINQLLDVVSRAAQQVSTSQLSTRAAKAIALEDRFRMAALDSIKALVQAVEAKDPYTRRHSEQVAHYCVELAEFLQKDEEFVETVRVAALLHDIGKIGVPDHILTKPDVLTAEEFAEIHKHPAAGADILRNVSMFATEALLVRAHHEHWDGSGYPDGLAGEEIPYGARLIHIADAMDAMLMRRTYKKAFPLETVLNEIRYGVGTQFDPALALSTLKWVEAHPDKVILPTAKDLQAT